VIAAWGAIGSAQAPEAVTFRLDWLPLSYHGPFHLAATSGYYRAAGIDLKILDGKGSGNTIQLIANGADTFGFADAGVVAKSVSQGVPVKMVMGVFKRSAIALMTPAETGIKTPQDVKDKRVATCAGDSAGILLAAYLKAVNVPGVKLVTVDCGAKYTVVAQGKADVTAAYGPYGRTTFTALGVKEVRKFDYTDAGLLLPGHGIIASLKTIESKPDLVRNFVAATARGWVEARKNPAAAAKALTAAVPLMKGKEATLEAEFKEWLEYLDTPNTAGKPFGWQSAEDWKKAEAILAQHMDVKPQPSVESYFTNRFIGE
jgi:NitT/TauT family transport system substrate-binding protein